MLIGYARVSTTDQNLDLQIKALEQGGCEKIFTDKISGSKSVRAGLDQALDITRAGDSLVVWKLDRLGRSVKHLVDLVSSLEKQEINFVSLTDSINTSTPSGRFFFHIMASLAEMERGLNLERTKAGLVAARALGRVGGRPSALSTSKLTTAQKLKDDGMRVADISEILSVSVPTLYRYLSKNR